MEILFEKENLSNMNSSSEFVFSILALAAQTESRNLSDHVRWALEKNYEKGIHRLGNNRVLGYDSINGELVPNQDAVFVKMAFEACTEGKSLSQIAKVLNQAGARRLRSKKGFDHSCVKYLLKNEIYTTVLNGAVNVEYCLTEAGRLLAGVLSKASDSAADFSCG